jgi:monooxygenase
MQPDVRAQGRSYTKMPLEHFDVLIVGAGLSGVGAACHLTAHCPGKTYAILEARDAIGGTWDLFRYPGIRSDSDMFTLGYAFKPWTEAKAIADGPSILRYVRETADEHGVTPHIRFRHKVLRAAWSTPEAKWTVEAQRAGGEIVRITCSVLYFCAGYYTYDKGYLPDFPGLENFRGRLVHPQQWTDDVDYKGKRVVVIGSGATAVTLVPEMAKDAAHVTMLQRSPSYIMSLPARDVIANFLRWLLPAKLAYALARWKQVLLSIWFFWLCRRRTRFAKWLIRAGVKKELPGFDIDTHFKPRYNPWDQRVCFVPDADLFVALREGRASMVTDQVDTFTARGVKLKSGRELEADVIVTATGLNLQAIGGAKLAVDGVEVEPSRSMSYKGMMLSDVPNFAYAVGYTNASWTLKVDLASRYLCRVINHMSANGYRQFTPRRNDPTVKEEPLIDFSSGYVVRSILQLPRQGDKVPWKLHQNYIYDLLGLKYGSVEDPAMEFANGKAAAKSPERAAA